jgi:hypothetical protein
MTGHLYTAPLLPTLAQDFWRLKGPSPGGISN